LLHVNHLPLLYDSIQNNAIHVVLLQLTYNHVSHPSSFFTSVLLGSATTSSPNVVVKSLRLGLQEAVIKAEVYAPRWGAGSSSSSRSIIVQFA
jgi:hypothetical protein